MSILIMERYADNYNLVVVLENLAKIYLNLSEASKAEKLLLKAIKIYEQTINIP